MNMKQYILVNEAKRLLNIVSPLLLEKETRNKYSIIFYYNKYTFVLIYIFNNAHRRSTQIQMILVGIMDEKLLTSRKSESKSIEYIRHLTVNSRR